MAGLRPGDVVGGVVSRVETFGVFVDLDGVAEPESGFVAPSELTWRRISACAEAVSPGERVIAEVLAVDTERCGQVALSLRALQENPWPGWADRTGTVLVGTVTR